jgi:hypothetical protein
MDEAMLPDLAGWEPTRDSLNLYAKVIGAIPRALIEPHPKWWHISLKVGPDGPATDSIPRGDGSFLVRMDLRQHVIAIETDSGDHRHVDITRGTSASAVGNEVSEALKALSITANIDSSKFEDNSPREYDVQAAERYLQALTSIDAVLKQQKSRIPGDTGPVQLWPHHFDIAFEWFGTKNVVYEENGKKIEYPSQINFGFSPGDDSHPKPYFYSNPWPFDEAFINHDLPSGATWFTESWKGSLLPYAQIASRGDTDLVLLDYFQAIYEVASPSLVE